MDSSGTPLLWICFGALVSVSLVLDLGIHSKQREMSSKQALLWAVFWIGLAVSFGAGTSPFVGPAATLDYFTAYLLEKALSVDNLFVFIVLFAYFKVPREQQHRVLFWGILGAIVTRGLFIFGGVALISRFHWMLYVLGGLLILTGGRLAFSNEEVRPEKNRLVRWARRVLPLVPTYNADRFTIRTSAGWRFTPLIIVLIAIESADVMFAVDSVPAVLAVSQDAFIVYTSNIFAILGLRALYFLLAGAMTRLEHLSTGLAVVLMFIGLKMLLEEVVHVPIGVSLAVVAGIIGIAVAASLLKSPASPPEEK